MIAYFTCITFIIVGIAITVVHGYLLENVTCGEPVIQPVNRRIVGGQEAIPGSWPWMVMLKERGSHVCGGSILNEQFILTAAHCFENETSSNPLLWQVYAGKYHIDHTDPTETLHHVKQIIVHPLYDINTMKHDLALVELQEPFVFNDHVRPVCIPQSGPKNLNTSCYAIGWGDTRGTGNNTILNQVVLPIIKDFICQLDHWYGESFVNGVTFCAGYSQGKMDGCTGDSGGPLNCKVNGKWYVQGVHSWGHDCAQPNRPGVYTNVFKYKPWINSTLSAKSTAPLMG